MTKQTLSDPSIIAALIKSHIQGQITLASQTLRGLFCLNAIVGLGVYLRIGLEKPQALFYCSIGAFLAVCASFTAWQLQRDYMHQDFQALKAIANSQNPKSFSEGFWAIFTLLFGLCSAILFLFGMGNAIN